jgi:hypothetical protein
MSKSLLAFADHVVRKAVQRGIPLMFEDIYDTADRFGVCLTQDLVSEIKYLARRNKVEIVY